MRFLIILLLTGCTTLEPDHFKEKTDPDKVYFAAADTMTQLHQFCGKEKDGKPIRACIFETRAHGKDIAVVVYLKGRIDSIWHERQHIVEPERFAVEFANELNKYGRN